MTPVETLPITVAAALLLTAAGYAHYRLPFHIAGRERLALARIALLATASAFGYVVARIYATAYGLPPIPTFLSAFGLVHVPAALPLFVKQLRGAGKS